MRLAISACVVGAVILAHSPATAGAVGDNPASSAEILAAVVDCAKAVTPGKIDPKAMADAGWKSGGGGKSKLGAIPLEQYYFGREGGNVINVVQVAGSLGTSCVTIAKLSAESQLAEIRAGIARQFAATAFADYPGDVPFKAFLLKATPTDAGKTMIGDRQRFAIATATIGGQPSIKIVMTPKRVEQ